MKIQDIANLAGVSSATVSRVINQSGYVKSETQKKIRKIIKEYNFKPNAVARSLSKNESSTIGVIVPDIKNPFFGEIIKGVNEVADINQLNILLYDTNEKFEKENKAIDILIEQRVKGAIICVSSDKCSHENLKRLTSAGIKFVIFDRQIKDNNYDGVFLDDVQGGYISTEALIKAGHKEIGIITGPLTSVNAMNRYNGYCKALEDNGIALNKKNVFEGNFKFDSGYKIMNEIIKNKKNITGILSCNNFMTLGVIKAMSENKLKISEDMALISFDNPDYFDMLDLNVSSIKRPVKDMGRVAIEILLNKFDRPSYTQKVIISPELDLKGSEILIKK